MVAGGFVGGTGYTVGNIQLKTDVWNSSNSSTQAGYLLHEIGHLFAIVAGMGGSSIVYDANSVGDPNPAKQAANAAALKPCTDALGTITH